MKGYFLKETEKYIRNEYRHYLKDGSNSSRVQKPHIHLPSLLEEISQRKWFQNCANYQEIIEYIENKNVELRNMFESDPELEKIQDKIDCKAIKGRCLYLCLDKQWYYDRDESKERVGHTKEQKKAIWENSSKCCYVCREKLSERNFFCGHKISVKNHGLTCVKNIVPICMKCNLEIGSKNM